MSGRGDRPGAGGVTSRVAVFAATLLLASPAQAQRACVTTAEAEALTLVAMPQIIRETGRVCATRLPRASLAELGDHGEDRGAVLVWIR